MKRSILMAVVAVTFIGSLLVCTVEGASNRRQRAGKVSGLRQGRDRTEMLQRWVDEVNKAYKAKNYQKIDKLVQRFANARQNTQRRPGPADSIGNGRGRDRKRFQSDSVKRRMQMYGQRLQRHSDLRFQQRRGNRGHGPGTMERCRRDRPGRGRNMLYGRQRKESEFSQKRNWRRKGIGWMQQAPRTGFREGGFRVRRGRSLRDGDQQSFNRRFVPERFKGERWNRPSRRKAGPGNRVHEPRREGQQYKDSDDFWSD